MNNYILRHCRFVCFFYDSCLCFYYVFPSRSHHDSCAFTWKWLKLTIFIFQLVFILWTILLLYTKLKVISLHLLQKQNIKFVNSSQAAAHNNLNMYMYTECWCCGCWLIKYFSRMHNQFNWNLKRINFKDFLARKTPQWALHKINIVMTQKINKKWQFITEKSNNKTAPVWGLIRPSLFVRVLFNAVKTCNGKCTTVNEINWLWCSENFWLCYNCHLSEYSNHQSSFDVSFLCLLAHIKELYYFWRFI